MMSMPWTGMARLREGYRALVIGSSGGIGQACVQALRFCCSN